MLKVMVLVSGLVHSGHTEVKPVWCDEAREFELWRPVNGLPTDKGATEEVL